MLARNRGLIASIKHRRSAHQKIMLLTASRFRCPDRGCIGGVLGRFDGGGAIERGS